MEGLNIKQVMFVLLVGGAAYFMLTGKAMAAPYAQPSAQPSAQPTEATGEIVSVTYSTYQ